MIDGSTQLVGVVGWPIEHSLSPTMHNAAFEALGLNWTYVPLPVSPGMEGESLRALATLGFAGANVTVPYKSALLRGLDSVTPDAERIGAVNTVVVRRQDVGMVSLEGHNTDHAGFMEALRQGGFDPAGESAVVAGAGGAARAAVFGLLTGGLSKAIVMSRRVRRAESLVNDLGSLSSGRLEPLEFSSDLLVDAVRNASLLVNATPVGMWPQEGTSIWPKGVPLPADVFVCDLVYIPRETQLLRQARDAGACGLGGLAMLIEQGAQALAQWTGREPPREIMRQACEQEMERRSL